MSTMDGPARKWEIKVTSKGQITLPKEARDIMMVRDGERLEATVEDDTLMLRRRDDLPESEKVRLSARRELRRMGVDPDVPHPELSHANVRKGMPKLPFTMAGRVRAQREGREELSE